MTEFCDMCSSQMIRSRRFERVRDGNKYPVSVYECPVCGWKKQRRDDKPDPNASKVNRHGLHFPDPDDPKSG